MNANDAIFSRVFATPPGGVVPDETPNEVGGVVSATFDLVVQAEAGFVVGGSGADYTLTVIATDLTTGATAALGVAPTPQSFDVPLWVKQGNDYVSVQRFTQSAAGLAGHILQYTASLRSKSGQIVRIKQSELFFLI